MKVSALLGISQENLAILLQVSRSQFAMFESGKRSLPVPAMEKLAVMLTHSQKKSIKSEVKKNNAVEEQKLLNKLLLKNSHQQLIVERKIKAFVKKQTAKEASKKIISHLLKEESKTNKSEIAFLKSIASKTENSTTTNSSTKLFELQLKKEVLVFEGELLQEKMKEIKK